MARILGDAPRSVEYRVRGFEETGLAALREGERSGRPRRLNEAQVLAVNVALRRTPPDLGLGGNLWDGKTLAAWIEREFAIHLGMRQCQRLFRQLDFRLRKPRPLIAKADPERKRAHKKTSSTDGGSDSGSLGEVQFQQHGSRCQMWVPPMSKDPVSLHAPYPEERRILRRSAVEGWEVSILPRDRKVQRANFLRVFENSAPYEHSNRTPRRRDY